MCINNKLNRMDAVLKYSYIQEASGNVKEKNNIKQKSEEVEGVLM